MQKKVLYEKNIYHDFFPLKLSKLNVEKLRYNCLLNLWGNFRQSQDTKSKFYNYFNLTDDKNVSWLTDYIMDIMKAKHNINLFKPKHHCLIQEVNESINFQSDLDHYDLHNIPTLSGLYTLTPVNDTNLILRYAGKNNLREDYFIPLEENKIILFNSEYDFAIEKNKESQPIINICFNFA